MHLGSQDAAAHSQMPDQTGHAGFHSPSDLRSGHPDAGQVPMHAAFAQPSPAAAGPQMSYSPMQHTYSQSDLAAARQAPEMLPAQQPQQHHQQQQHLEGQHASGGPQLGGAYGVSNSFPPPHNTAVHAPTTPAARGPASAAMQFPNASPQFHNAFDAAYYAACMANGGPPPGMPLVPPQEGMHAPAGGAGDPYAPGMHMSQMSESFPPRTVGMHPGAAGGHFMPPYGVDGPGGHFDSGRRRDSAALQHPGARGGVVADPGFAPGMYGGRRGPGRGPLRDRRVPGREGPGRRGMQPVVPGDAGLEELGGRVRLRLVLGPSVQKSASDPMQCFAHVLQ